MATPALVARRIIEDACAIEVAGGVLVAAADPIMLTAEEIGRLSVVVNANDVAVTGARPRWFLAVILVPPGTGSAAVRDLFAAISRALERISAHLVGGHTERGLAAGLHELARVRPAVGGDAVDMPISA